jgi:LppX/LprAFG-like lipoprotein
MISFHISMRRAMACVALTLASALLIAGCSLPWQHNTTAVANGFGPKPTAQQVLSTLKKNFRSVTTFHMTMKVDNLGNTKGNQIQIRSADGDVIMPDKVKAQANVLFSGQPVTVKLVSIGDIQYLTDPITGQWRVVKGVLNASTLTNPDTGIFSLATKLQNATGPTDDTVNGTPCWRVNGLLDAKNLAFFTGGGVPAGTMLQTSVCAGKADGLPYQLSAVGQAASSDTPQTSRTFTISGYNENITITAPQV